MFLDANPLSEEQLAKILSFTICLFFFFGFLFKNTLHSDTCWLQGMAVSMVAFNPASLERGEAPAGARREDPTSHSLERSQLRAVWRAAAHQPQPQQEKLLFVEL